MGADSINISKLEPNINNMTARNIIFRQLLVVFTIIRFVTNAKYKMPWTISYLLIIIIVQYFVNMSLTDKMCGEKCSWICSKNNFDSLVTCIWYNSYIINDISWMVKTIFKYNWLFICESF